VADAMLLDLEALTIRFGSTHGGQDALVAVDAIDLTIERGEWLALVGESGCGKSLTSSALVGLAPESADVSATAYRFDGRAIDLDGESVRGLRGTGIGLVFQDPLAALDPVETIGAQLVETLRADRAYSKADGRAKALSLLAEAGLPEPSEAFARVAHELSGGQRQRATLALALAREPKLLVADEATTALDPTLRLGLVAHLDRLRRERGLAILFVTHDLGLVAHAADRIAVMYAGRIVEIGPRDALLESPRHPYTQGLVASIPALGRVQRRLPTIRGVVPTLGQLPTGCAFGPRCDRVADDCRSTRPPLDSHAGRSAACFHPLGPRP